MEDIKNKLIEKLNYFKDGSLTMEDLLKEILDIIDIEERENNEEEAVSTKGPKYPKKKKEKMKKKQKEDNEENIDNEDTEEMEDIEEMEKTEEEEMSKYTEKEYFLFSDRIFNSEKFNGLRTDQLVEDIKLYKPDIYIDHQEKVSDKVFIKEIFSRDGNWYLKLVGDKNILEKFNHLSPSIVKDEKNEIYTISEISLTNNPKLPQSEVIEVGKYSASWEVLPKNFKKFILIKNDFKSLKLFNKFNRDKIEVKEEGSLSINSLKESIIKNLISEREDLYK